MKKLSVYMIAFGMLILFLTFSEAQILTWDATKAARIEQNIGFGSDPEIAISGDTAVAVWSQHDGISYRIYSNYSKDGGATWNDTRLVEDNGGSNRDAICPQVVISGNTAVAVWEQYDITGTKSIYSNYATIDINGDVSWNPANAVTVENNEYTAYSPQIAISGNTVVAVWEQEEQMSSWPHDIYSNNATITGGVPAWNIAKQISYANWDGQSPQITISGDTAVAVWRGSSGGNYDIYSNRSTDGGANWGNVQTVDNVPNTAYYPQIASFGNTVVAVWYQYDGSQLSIYSNYAIIDGSGDVAWNPANAITIENKYYNAEYPQVAISEGNAVAVWYQSDGTYSRIYSNCATIDGAGVVTWSPNVITISNDTYNAYDPQIAISGDTAVAVWRQQLAGGDNPNHIYSNYSIDGGGTWQADAQRIDNLDGNANYPQIAISGDTAVAVWRQEVTAIGRIFSNYVNFPEEECVRGGNGGCFIATAAFGSSMAKQIEILRQFRDKYLLTNAMGQRFVAWYYREGPIAASYLLPRPIARAAVRIILYPLIIFSFLLVKGILPYLVFFLCAGIFLFRIKRILN